MNNYYVLYLLLSMLLFAEGDKISQFENRHSVKESIISSSLIEMQLQQNDQTVHEFSEYDFSEEGYNKIDIRISYISDFSYETTFRSFQIDIQTIDTLKNISAALRFNYGNYHLEERSYTIANFDSDTSDDVFFTRFFFTGNGNTNSIDIASGEIVINTFTQNSLEGNFEITFVEGSDFDVLSGVFVKDF